MASFYVWSIFIILYQTIISMVFAWLTLQCRLAPNPTEARELTLIKMLYLYEPDTCGRIYYYNYTVPKTHMTTLSNILWMKSNWIAESFRNKVKLSMSLHVAWLGLALLNASQGRRPCGFYAVLLPLTAIGIALLVVDLVHAAFFLHDATKTQTEAAIWDYIQDVDQVKKIDPFSTSQLAQTAQLEDTSWVSLLFAYVSMRGVVQWIVNFWIVQDNYFDGLKYYRELNQQKKKGDNRSYSYEF